MIPAFPQNKNFLPRKFEPCKNSPLFFSSQIQTQFPTLTQQPVHLVQTKDSLDNLSSCTKLIRRVAVVFSGGPAPGGHNVVAALFDSFSQLNIQLLGVQGGPKGLLEGTLIPISISDRNRFINTGGFCQLGTDRTKISTNIQFEKVLSVCKKNNIHALVIIGGDDSNTNAAFLAESLAKEKICVVGIPKTIDGDLQIGSILPISFGFDTATKVYIETVENLICEAQSSRKHWHFIKLMGRSASHVTLEVALQTRPHITLISEEIWQKNFSIAQIIAQISQNISSRFQRGFPYGVVLIPEGIFERIDLQDPQLQQFLSGDICQKDDHGNIAWSRIQTETLLSLGVERHLRENFPQVKISFLSHFLGYEGRCAIPSLFDKGYSYLLGQTAANLILQGCTGYLACVSQIAGKGYPQSVCLPALFSQEIRKNQKSWVIEKSLVSLESPAFKTLTKNRIQDLFQDPMQSVGPRQYSLFPKAPLPVSVVLNQQYSQNFSSILELFS